jgi:outer membrane protein OmpA-like peptidoglycan-associated protein/Mg-chelatase subunit ChlD/TolA-binding protein
MRYLLLFLCILPFLAKAQDYSGMVEDQKFDKAWKKCQKVLKKNPESLEEVYFSALIQSRILAGDLFNPIEAQEKYKKAQQLYKEITDVKKLEKLDEIPINLKAFRSLNDSISRGGLIQAKILNTEQGYIDYLNMFPSSSDLDKQYAILERNRLAFILAKTNNTEISYQGFIDKYPGAIEVKEAKNLRNQVAFSTAIALNSIEGYDDFLRKYPEAGERNLALSKRNALAFMQAKEKNTIEAFEYFIQKYPDATEVNAAQVKIHELAFEIAKASQNSQIVEKFIQRYPNSIQLSDARLLLQDLIYKENVNESDWLSLKTFIELYPTNRNNLKAFNKIKSLSYNSTDFKLIEYLLNNDPFNDTLIQQFYKSFCQDGELSTLKKFQAQYPQYINNSFYPDYQQAEQNEKLFLHLPFDKRNLKMYIDFISNGPSKELSFVALQRILSPYIATNQFSEALKLMDRVPIDKNLSKVKNLKELLNAKNDPNIQPKLIKGINTSGNEFSPVISADEKSIFFCGQNRYDNLGGEDIFESVKVIGGFKQPIMNALSTSDENEAPVAISSDGTKLIYFQSGKLFVSEKNKSGWSLPEELNQEINKGEWQGDAMLSSDGNVLLFSSFRPGEVFNLNGMSEKYYHGDLAYPTDIFICEKDKNGNWKYPVNIGSVINSPYCDRFPFLHPDMKTLYFSSDGHGGFGKLDVFKSTRISDSCWTCWTEPINMGREINTIESDAGYKISTSGELAYFTQNKRKIQESSVMFVLDVSGSMDGEKIQQLREVSKITIQEVINNNAEIAIAAFDGDCIHPITHYLPFTRDYSQVELFIDNLQAGGGTPMYEAYFQASKLLKANNKNPLKNRVIVLMTDGDATCGSALDPVLNQLKSQNSLFKTQSIAYGVSENSKAYFDLLQIANVSGGTFFEANTTQDLGAAFENVNNSIFQIISGSDNKEIFEINLPFHLRPDMVAKIEGELKNSKNEPISTTIRWEDLESDKVIGIAKTDPSDGSYFIALPLGKNYGYYVEDSTYFPVSNNIDLRNVSTQIEVNNNIQVVTFQEMIDQGIAVSMNNLFFAFGKYFVLPASYPELKRIAKIIERYDLKVEIDGHTDDVGDDESNLVLSDKRALAVKDYLVRIGCKEEMLITHGYGESKPLHPNDNDANRAKNRRVELRLIK